jgi:hypothetical protein
MSETRPEPPARFTPVEFCDGASPPVVVRVSAANFRRLVLIGGISVAVLVNSYGAVRPAYKGVQHPAGDDLVSVYPYTGGPGEMPVSVREWRPPNDPRSELVDTGQLVRVYLRNTYKDDIIVWYPRMTLRILGATLLLYVAVGFLIRRTRKTGRAERAGGRKTGEEKGTSLNGT